MTTTAIALREAMQVLPGLAVTSTGVPPQASDIFFPESHAEVLDPDVSLVVGNRGMGKTFWALALADAQLRARISERYVRLRKWQLDGLDAQLGFADAEGVRGVVSRADLEAVQDAASSEDIWRAVYLKATKIDLGKSVPKNFRQLVSWVADNPTGQRDIFVKLDGHFSSKKGRFLLVVDQLDQLATDWGKIQDLTKGLLRLALALKSYRNLKIKLFMRPDQAENREIFRFPDASKVTGSARPLTWRPIDLYGLLFFEIMKVPSGKNAFFSVCREVGIDSTKLHERLQIPMELAKNPDAQGSIFDKIAGAMMGKGSKRGRPYTWIPTHLADARGEISPRTFLHVMKTAAEHDGAELLSTAIDFVGIQEGVRRASSNRLSELEEDYPWVSLALSPLKGLLVPCFAKEIILRWSSADTLKSIRYQFRGRSAPISLALSRGANVQDQANELLRVLSEVGVIEERDGGKINVPDIFRVKAGVLRKGGVSPQRKNLG